METAAYGRKPTQRQTIAQQHVLDARMLPAPHQGMRASYCVGCADQDDRGEERGHAGVEAGDEPDCCSDLQRNGQENEKTRRSKAHLVEQQGGASDVAELGNCVGYEKQAANDSNRSFRVHEFGSEHGQNHRLSVSGVPKCCRAISVVEHSIGVLGQLIVGKAGLLHQLNRFCECRRGNR
jgi:hypothetical protein